MWDGGWGFGNVSEEKGGMTLREWELCWRTGIGGDLGEKEEDWGN